MLLVCCDHCNCCQGTLLFITFDSMKEEMRPWRAGAHQTVPIVAAVTYLSTAILANCKGVGPNDYSITYGAGCVSWNPKTDDVIYVQPVTEKWQ